MGRRIRWLGVVMVICFGLAIVQLVNIQVVKAPSLRASDANPRNEGKQYENQRGDIYASDGTLLAESVKSSSGPYHYMREYPQGSLYSQVVGYSDEYYGTGGIENQYNSYLVDPHAAGPDLLAGARVHPVGDVERQSDAYDRSESPTDGADCPEPDHRVKQGCRRGGR